jgi:hypothetical protein
MGNFFLLDNNFLLENLHSIDSLGVLLPYLIDLAKSALSNELQDGKVVWPVVSLVSPLIGHLNVDFSGMGNTGIVSTAKGKPALDGVIVILDQSSFDIKVAQELFVRAVVDSNVDARV